jgi:hypothetical protein
MTSRVEGEPGVCDPRPGRDIGKKPRIPWKGAQASTQIDNVWTRRI